MASIQALLSRGAADAQGHAADLAIPSLPGPLPVPDVRPTAGKVGRPIGRLILTALAATQAVGVALAITTKRRLSPTIDPSSYEVVLAGIFGPLEFTSTASAFKGGTLACLFGGGTVDLRGAVMDPAGARLRVTAFNGGAQLLVPRTWRIVSKVVGLGGVGIDQPPEALPADAPVLTIEGWAMFGGFGVSTEAPEATT